MVRFLLSHYSHQSCFSTPQNDRFVVAVLFKHLATEFDVIDLGDKARLTQKQKCFKEGGAGGSYVEGY